MGNSLSCKEKKWLSLPPGLPIGPAIRSLVGRWYRGGTRFSRPAFFRNISIQHIFFSRRKITQINGNFGFLILGISAAILSAEKLSKEFWAKLRTISWFVVHQKEVVDWFLVFTWLVGVDGNKIRRRIESRLPITCRLTHAADCHYTHNSGISFWPLARMSVLNCRPDWTVAF